MGLNIFLICTVSYVSAYTNSLSFMFHVTLDSLSNKRTNNSMHQSSLCEVEIAGSLTLLCMFIAVSDDPLV